jgi:hypothetical protein
MADDYPPVGQLGSRGGILRYYWADPAWPQVFKVPYGSVFYGQLHQKVGHNPHPSGYHWRDGVSVLPVGVCDVCPFGVPHYIDGVCMPDTITIQFYTRPSVGPDFGFEVTGVWDFPLRKYVPNVLPFGPSLDHWILSARSDPYSTDFLVEVHTPSGVQIVHVPAPGVSPYQFERSAGYVFDADVELLSFLPLFPAAAVWW